MLVLGTLLIASIATAPPAAATTTSVRAVEQLASTYDEASCDPSDGGECAEEVIVSLPLLPAILDCESPFIQEMIGSCDMPRPSLPTLHVPTVRNGGTSFGASRGRSGDQLSDGITPPSPDGILPLRSPTLDPLAPGARVFEDRDIAIGYAPPKRLDRPPRV